MANPVVGESATSDAVFGNSEEGRGVVGVSRTAAGVEGNSRSGDGVFGTSEQGRGVVGVAKDATGVEGNSTSGDGVFGTSEQGRGVVGVAKDATGVEGNSTSGAGVFGSSQTSIGIFGKGGRLAGLFEGNVEVTGSLTVQGVNLIQRIQQLEQQVQMLSSQVARLSSQVTVNPATGGAVTAFTIDVTVAQSEVKVIGQGFRPSVKCFIIVVYPDLSRKVFEETANSSGGLSFSTSTSNLCIPGLTLALNFTVNQPDTSGHDKFTNTVVKSVTC